MVATIRRRRRTDLKDGVQSDLSVPVLCRRRGRRLRAAGEVPLPRDARPAGAVQPQEVVRVAKQLLRRAPTPISLLRQAREREAALRIRRTDPARVLGLQASRRIFQEEAAVTED